MTQTLKFLVVAGICAASFIACDKDDNEDDNVVSRTGLEITGAQEVPAKTGPATGSMDVSYNKMTKMLSYTVRWEALSGPPTGSHIHGIAPRGVNAGVKHDFFPQFPKTVSGTFMNSVLVDGTQIKEDSLLLGYYYVNIHTALNPGGEIRGQIEF